MGARQWRAVGLMLLVILCLLLTAHADMDQTQREIQHLMDYIAGSQCRFIRNGKTYDAEAARAHIQRKYDHVRRRVRTTEDFIDLAASRSSMSGDPYRVQCGARTWLCADWLRAALEHLRQQE
jgi:hypothetical protein